MQQPDTDGKFLQFLAAWYSGTHTEVMVVLCSLWWLFFLFGGGTNNEFVLFPVSQHAYEVAFGHSAWQHVPHLSTQCLKRDLFLFVLNKKSIAGRKYDAVALQTRGEV